MREPGSGERTRGRRGRRGGMRNGPRRPDRAELDKQNLEEIQRIKERQNIRRDFFASQGGSLPPAMQKKNDDRMKAHINAFATDPDKALTGDLVGDLKKALAMSKAIRLHSTSRIAPEVITDLRSRNRLEWKPRTGLGYEEIEGTLSKILKEIEEKIGADAAERIPVPAKPDADPAAVEAPRKPRVERAPAVIPESEWLVQYGVVQKVILTGGSKMQLLISKGGGGKGKKEVMTEAELPELKNCTEGHLIVVESKREDGSGLTILDRLGEAGTYKAERARLAYEIGNGRKFPKQVREDAKKWEVLGEKAIKEAIDEVGGEANLVDATKPDWQDTFKHGERRVDFRKVTTMTIDPRNAKDYDDALSVQEVTRKGKKYTEIGVHIADVSHFLSMKKGERGHEIFKEALRRQFTAYFEGEAYPMLPEILSNDLCSLKEGVDRLAFSTLFYVGEDGKIDSDLTWRGKAVINSDKQLIYEKAEEHLNAPESKDEESEVEMDADGRVIPKKKHYTLEQAIKTIAKHGVTLRQDRMDRGHINEFVQRGEMDVMYNAAGGVESVSLKEEIEMNRVIADWMLHANEAGARFMWEESIATNGESPALFRVHEPPLLKLADGDDPRKPSKPNLWSIAKKYGAKDILADIEKFVPPPADAKRDPDEEPFVNQIVRRLFAFSRSKEFRISQQREDRLRAAVNKAFDTGQPHSLLGGSPKKTEEKIQEELKRLADDDRKEMQKELFRLFRKARMTMERGDHFGIAAMLYGWLTSPIRRNVDILTHEIIQWILQYKGVSVFNKASIEHLQSWLNYGNDREKRIRNAARDSWCMWAAKQFKDSGMIGSEITVRIQRFMDPRRPGEKPAVLVRVPLPSGPRSERRPSMTFKLPMNGFRNLLKRTEGREVVAKLRSADEATGFLGLTYISTVRDVDETPVTLLAPEQVTRIRNQLLRQISQVEQTYSEAIKDLSDIEQGLNTLHEKVENMSEKATERDVAVWKRALADLEAPLMYNYEGDEEISPADEAESDEEEFMTEEEERKAELILELQMLLRRQDELVAQIEDMQGKPLEEELEV